MPSYTTRAKLDIVFGEINVTRWGNLSNTNNIRNKEINDRIDYLIEVATSYINGRLQLTRYTDNIPFAEDHVPKMIEFVTTILSGALLFDGRINRVHSEDKEVNRSKKEFARIMRQILCGQLKLEDPLSGELLGTSCLLAPSVAVATTHSHGAFSTCLCTPGCYCSSCIDSRVIGYSNYPYC